MEMNHDEQSQQIISCDKTSMHTQIAGPAKIVSVLFAFNS